MLITQSLHGVCAKEAHIAIQQGVIQSVMLVGGCDGQGKVLDALLSGMTPQDAIQKLKDIRCGKRDTSCAAELARVLSEVLN